LRSFDDEARDAATSKETTRYLPSVSTLRYNYISIYRRDIRAKIHARQRVIGHLLSRRLPPFGPFASRNYAFRSSYSFLLVRFRCPSRIFVARDDQRLISGRQDGERV